MKFPQKIRLPHEAYANRESVSHVVIATHPGVGRLRQPVAEAVWAAVLEQRTRGSVELLVACLMPDHLHLILRPGQDDLLRFLNAWKSWSTTCARRAGHPGVLWQPGMWDRTCRGKADLEAVAEYVVQNPVAARLAEDAREWPWTWAWWWDEDDGNQSSAR